MFKFGNLRSYLRATAALPFAAAVLAAGHVSPALAGQFKILYTFKNGSQASGSLISDDAGNLYGTTQFTILGTVFKLAPDGTETTLYTFCSKQNCKDGSLPVGGVIRDKAGNLYGTAESGGVRDAGVVFKLAPDGTEKVLHAFTGGSDGRAPFSGVIEDKAGNLYGTTVSGGTNDVGTVFELAKAGGGRYTETVLHSFGGSSDGRVPVAGLIEDSAGNLYGTTYEGGVYGSGIVFELAPDGTETVLHAFCSEQGCPDGARPVAGLIENGAGNLYGTTGSGGTYGLGTVFELAPDGTETVLHSFGSSGDGKGPGGLIEDKAGNLYGTTGGGGRRFRAGTVFKLAPDGAETVLHRFSHDSKPIGSLVKDTPDGKGDLFGVTFRSRSCCGVVFEIKK